MPKSNANIGLSAINSSPFGAMRARVFPAAPTGRRCRIMNDTALVMMAPLCRDRNICAKKGNLTGTRRGSFSVSPIDEPNSPPSVV